MKAIIVARITGDMYDNSFQNTNPERPKYLSKWLYDLKEPFNIIAENSKHRIW